MVFNAPTARTERPRAYGPFYLRAFVSIMMIGFLLLFTISGVALFVSPPGQLANTISWTLLGLGKGQWEALHIAFGFLWLPLAVLHLVFNRRVLTGYLRDRVRRAFVWRRELIAAIVVTAFLGVASVLDLPPVAQLMAWEESFAEFWAARSPSITTVPSAGGAAVGPAFGDPLGAPASGAYLGGGGMGRYATIDAETGALRPVGKEAAARAEEGEAGATAPD